MSIYEIISAKSATVIAKDAPRNPPRPMAFSMADLMADAKRCNARFAATWKHNNGYAPAPPVDPEKSNAAKKAHVEARYAVMSAEIEAMLRERGRTRMCEIMRAKGLSSDVATRIMRRMRDEGIVRAFSGGRPGWEVVK